MRDGAKNTVLAAGQAFDRLTRVLDEVVPDYELLVRSNTDGFVFAHTRDDIVFLGTKVFVNLMKGEVHFKAYADSAAEGIMSCVARAQAWEASNATV